MNPIRGAAYSFCQWRASRAVDMRWTCAYESENWFYFKALERTWRRRSRRFAR